MAVARVARAAAALTAHPSQADTANAEILKAAVASTFACFCWWMHWQAPHASKLPQHRRHDDGPQLDSYWNNTRRSEVSCSRVDYS
jgi:hypothetical protein